MYEAQRHWGHESGGKVVLYRQFKCMPELEPYAKAHLPLATCGVIAGLQSTTPS